MIVFLLLIIVAVLLFGAAATKGALSNGLAIAILLFFVLLAVGYCSKPA